jgi:hypothetical protein
MSKGLGLSIFQALANTAVAAAAAAQPNKPAGKRKKAGCTPCQVFANVEALKARVGRGK